LRHTATVWPSSCATSAISQLAAVVQTIGNNLGQISIVVVCTDGACRRNVPAAVPAVRGMVRIIEFITLSADIRKIWITSAATPKRPASLRHSGHRGGITSLRRRWGKVWRFFQTGI
jgi:hypothetical protein